MNFGHAVGHAIEAYENGRLLHGECVAIGIRKELEVAVMKGLAKQEDVDRIVRLLEKYGHNTELEKHYDLEVIDYFLMKDK